MPMICIDMKMPACCNECPFLDDNGDYPYCLVLQSSRGYTFSTRTRRFPNCPLIDQDKEDEKHRILLEQYDTALALLKEYQKKLVELKDELNDVYEKGCTLGC